MKLYMCFTDKGMVMAKAGAIDQQALLRLVQAIAYLGPMRPAQVTEYLEGTYPLDAAKLTAQVTAFLISADTCRELLLEHPQRHYAPNRR